MKTNCVNGDVGNGLKKRKENGTSEILKSNEIQNGDINGKHANSVASSEKQFVPRNAPFTDTQEIKHMKAVYNVFAVTIIYMFGKQAGLDLAKGTINLGFNMIYWNFQGLQLAVFYWLVMNFTTVLLYYSYRIWANWRVEMTHGSFVRKMWDYSCLVSFITYQSMLLYIPAIKITENYMSPGATFFLVAEQLRLMMKNHAFVRSNAPKVLSYKLHQSEGNQDSSVCPDFSKFLYYMFAPTFIYRESYPRTNKIRWKFVTQNLMELFAIMLFLALLLEQVISPTGWYFGLPEQRTTSASAYMLTGLFSNMLIGAFVEIFSFYMIFHAWLNVAAELLCFADRQFYKEWWTAESLASYFRQWNGVVNDWLFTFVYKDCRDLFWPKQQVGPAVAVFIVSAVFHEYAVALCLRYFYPVLFIAFAVMSVPLSLLTRNMKLGNWFVWFCVSHGIGLLLTLHSWEWYARINCPRVLDPFWDFFVPRSWMCENI